MLICALLFVTGGRFPRARPQPPRRKSLLWGLRTRAFPAGVAAFHSKLLVPINHFSLFFIIS